MITCVHSRVRMKWVPHHRDTAACKGPFFLRTIHAHFERGIFYVYCTIWMHRNLPTVNVKMLSQDTAMIGDRTPTTGKCTLDLESDTLTTRPPWPNVVFELNNSTWLKCDKQTQSELFRLRSIHHTQVAPDLGIWDRRIKPLNQRCLQKIFFDVILDNSN